MDRVEHKKRSEFLQNIITFNLKVEREILSFVLYHGVTPKGWSILKEEYFFSPQNYIVQNWPLIKYQEEYLLHQELFIGLKEMINDKIPIDVLTAFLHFSEKRKKISSCFLTSIGDNYYIPDLGNLYYHTLIFIQNNIQIKVIQTLFQITSSTTEKLRTFDGKMLNDDEATIHSIYYKTQSIAENLISQLMTRIDIIEALDIIINLFQQQSVPEQYTSQIIQIKNEHGFLPKMEDDANFISLFSTIKRCTKNINYSYEKQESLQIISDLFLAVVNKKTVRQDQVNQIREFKKQIIDVR
jgi:hypothetical protein